VSEQASERGSGMTHYWGLDPQKKEEDDTVWVVPGIIPAEDGMADEFLED
jgi:hypothetical protein